MRWPSSSAPRRARPLAAATALTAITLAGACRTTSSAGSSATGSSAASTSSTATSGAGGSGGTITFKGEAWADNWFAVYVGDALVAEDHVPIATTKSFNAETFTFEAGYPFTLAFVLKDYIENDTGLEYIGMPNQQIGDGGFAFQLTDASTGDVVLVSNSDWRCHVVHKAPLDKGCEKSTQPEQDCTFSKEPEPDGWKEPAFDDSTWDHATEHTAAAVGPKDGYNDITWDPSVTFIWSADLESDNTVLCRVTVAAPTG